MSVSYARHRAESLMLDAGSATRPDPDGRTRYDEVLDADVPVTTPVIDETRCKIQSRALVASEAEVGGRTSVSQRLELHLPVDTVPLTVGDVFTVMTPHALSTVPAGTQYRVTGPAGGTLRTARRYEVELVSS